MSTSLDDFIISVRNGYEGPNIPSIRRNMRGDQVFELPFKNVCNGYCKKHEIHPLSLYTIMQQGICEDMSRRSERSSLFRNLLDKVKNDWGYDDLYLPDIFVVKNVDFDENHITNERQYLSSLIGNLNTINDTISDNDDENTIYDSLESMNSDVDDCLERNGNHMLSLSVDNKSPYTNLWGDMSTLMKSDYLESLQDTSDDSNILRYATKKINKEIPDETPQMFTNLNLLEIMKLKKLEEYKREITSLINELQVLKNNIESTLNTLPMPLVNNTPSKSWLSYFMGDVSEDEDPEDYEDADIDNTQSELKEAIQGLDYMQSYKPENNDENDILVDETGVDVDGGVEVFIERDIPHGTHDKTNDNTKDEFVLSFDTTNDADEKKFNFF
tara:strand:- start:422 stop:1579 length:1158 start_codon:yes stop_codon:yes gene_type:complete